MRAVFLARPLPLARTVVSLPPGAPGGSAAFLFRPPPAAARGVPIVPFFALTVAGCALWAIAFVTGGVLLGASWATVNSVLGRVLLGLGLVAIALVLHRHRPRASPSDAV